jgi:hypothetical protein
MAKISQREMKLNLDPSRPSLKTKVAVYYDSTDKTTANYARKVPDKRFYVKLPKVVADCLGRAESRGGTQEEALVQFEKDLDAFRNTSREQNKVIIYSIRLSPNPTKDAGVEIVNTGYSITVNAEVFEETVTTDGSGSKRYSYESVSSTLKYPKVDFYITTNTWGKREERQIPWSEKNEKFFLKLAKDLSAMITWLSEMTDPEKLIAAIGSGDVKLQSIVLQG